MHANSAKQSQHFLSILHLLHRSTTGYICEACLAGAVSVVGYVSVLCLAHACQFEHRAAYIT
jgi:hypothetical protein